VQLRPCASKVFAVRKKLGHPQVLSTSRHISQGAFDIKSMIWDESRNTLSGVSKVIAGEPYDIVLYIPDSFRLFVEGNDTLSSNLKGLGKYLWVMRLNPGATGEVSWSVAFTVDFPR
jgi:hypothetical protein